ncbi:MAG: endonuclease/exonuclease/phosphatase family protein [Gemmatimonadota bacterium]|uniref:endonuclease/exonuclease/phosphatase family protein n=1 Tax=Candidatus Palauibacter scopulicola TaxID=3056741 RepID=UPI002396A3D1|nr:endonuclease/exonuclease/phosphatase family protein [Candidatus Palauibacter scopulicola]MDE2664412.1 endonuclease/exonuclease/phosphatase family protein [Candidatus Palauibacter scopulicola]
MKLLTWNVNRAGKRRGALWKTVTRVDADIVLLQEVTGIPRHIRRRYQCQLTPPRYFRGHNAPFSTAVLSKGPIDATLDLKSAVTWVDKIHTERYGWIVGCKTTLDSGERFHVVAVHSPSFPIPPRQWADVDVSGIKLSTNPRLWFTEILWALLRTAGISDDTNWIVGGDFNRSVLHKGGQEVIDRLKTLGLTDCLSHHHGGPVPTYQPTRKVVRHQLDYCYVNTPLLERLTEARVPSHEEVFDPKPRLSDHLPIICTFD